MAGMDELIDQFKALVDAAHKIVIIQADNPDGDSLATALALEQIFHELGKEPYLYCGIDMPDYLKYLPGWDRVAKEMPTQFDASVVVDTSSITLLDRLEHSDMRGWVAGRPCAVIDHHAEVPCDIPFATVCINDAGKVSTGELVYDIAKKTGWLMNLAAKEFIMTSILADSLGLITENTTAQTYRVMAELIEAGVNRPALEEKRRAFTKMPEEIFRYKARLIERTEFGDDGRVAIVTIPQDEINTYSPLFNPNPLIQGEHLQTKGVLVSVAIKHYDSGRVTAGIRCNTAAPVAAALAQKFGGDGHRYSAGFKIENGRSVEDIKNDCMRMAAELLAEIPKDNDETVQHTF
jgi:phosphoesterase RecJ-like protein